MAEGLFTAIAGVRSVHINREERRALAGTSTGCGVGDGVGVFWWRQCCAHNRTCRDKPVSLESDRTR